MNLLAIATDHEVVKAWGNPNIDNDPTKLQMLRSKPRELEWRRAEIEAVDIERLYCITRPEWVDLTQSTFRLARAIANIERSSENPHTLRIQDEVGRLLRWTREFDPRGLRLFAVTDALEPDRPITLVDGVAAAIALAKIGKLAVASLFLGVAPAVRDWPWARESYREGAPQAPARRLSPPKWKQANRRTP